MGEIVNNVCFDLTAWLGKRNIWNEMEVKLCVLFGLKWNILLLVGKAYSFNIRNKYLVDVFSIFLDVKVA